MAERQPDVIRQTPAVYGEPEPAQGAGLAGLASGGSSPLARHVSSGRLIPARLDLLSLGRPPDAPREMSISDALNEQRSES